MSCCKGLPQIALRNIFWRIRCISACCGKIVIQASDIDGGEIPKGIVLNDAKYQILKNKIHLWLQKQDTFSHR